MIFAAPLSRFGCGRLCLNSSRRLIEGSISQIEEMYSRRCDRPILLNSVSVDLSKGLPRDTLGSTGTRLTA